MQNKKFAHQLQDAGIKYKFQRDENNILILSKSFDIFTV